MFQFLGEGVPAVKVAPGLQLVRLPHFLAVKEVPCVLCFVQGPGHHDGGNRQAVRLRHDHSLASPGLLSSAATGKVGLNAEGTARLLPGGPFLCAGMARDAAKGYASMSTLVTLGSTEMPGPNVVATVAFWM